MQLQDLGAFVTVAAERSFSVAAKKLHRTQPAVSQAIRRLEEELGDRLFDRSVRNGALTEAGRLLRSTRRLLRLAAEAEAAVRELQQVRRGRVIIGANEAAVHSLLPYLDRFAKAHPQALVEVRRVPSRADRAEVLDRTPGLRRADVSAGRDSGLQSHPLGGDELVMLAHPGHPLAGRRRVDDRGSRAARRSSRTTIRRRRASACCGSTNADTRRSTSRSRCRASTASSAPSKWASASRCCRGAARSARSRAASWSAIKVPGLESPRASGPVRVPARRACRMPPTAFLEIVRSDGAGRGER